MNPWAPSNLGCADKLPGSLDATCLNETFGTDALCPRRLDGILQLEDRGYLAPEAPRTRHFRGDDVRHQHLDVAVTAELAWERSYQQIMPRPSSGSSSIKGMPGLERWVFSPSRFNLNICRMHGSQRLADSVAVVCERQRTKASTTPGAV